MKKFIRCIVFILCVVTTLMVAGCGNSNNKTDNTSVKEEKTEIIKVYNGNTPVEYTVTLGKSAKIDVLYKSDYYFVGAYDAEEGGTKYFDAQGNSTLIWSAGNPNVFYARFASIYDITYTDVMQDESPYAWSGQYDRYDLFEFSDELKNAIAGNYDKNLKVKVSAKVSCDKSWEFANIWVTNLVSGGESYSVAKEVALTGGSYTSVSKTLTMPASLFKKGQIIVYFRALSTNVTGTQYYFKNVTVDVSFAK